MESKQVTPNPIHLEVVDQSIFLNGLAASLSELTFLVIDSENGKDIQNLAFAYKSLAVLASSLGEKLNGIADETN